MGVKGGLGGVIVGLGLLFGRYGKKVRIDIEI